MPAANSNNFDSFKRVLE